ncbi:hypothetical protein [Rariglobus hedericola]|uniref:Uncharacterized protein n=1 Tax=Rariglobus hedericola TaxID=2597822 RepID=A0A556QR08_9BACT|nr:hypothetical protein [Rariglobus hedericola]TSJ79075.1 hypothetical protein FPL22_07210 [Rariglobus hedericola]
MREQEIAQRVEELNIRVGQQARDVEELKNAKTHQPLDVEAYERRLALNREFLGNLKARQETMSAESLKPLLRVVDHPVLAKPDEYVRHSILGFVRWRLAISALAGLMAALIFRRKATMI